MYEVTTLHLFIYNKQHPYITKMKRLLLYICLTMAAAMSMQAQSQSFAVHNGKAAVRFNLEQVDSIIFHNNDTCGVDAALLVKAGTRIDSLKAIVATLRADIANLSNKLDNTDTKISTAIKQVNSTLDVLEKRVDEVNENTQEQIGLLTDRMEQLADNLAETNNRVNAGTLMTDAFTGQRYKLCMRDGNIEFKPVGYKNILILGNSFTCNGTSPGVWWSWHSMAASCEKTAYTEYIKESTDADLEIIGMWDFELNYSTEYAFEENIPIHKNYDAVIVQIQENASYKPHMQASWEALYDYLHKSCPDAEVIQCMGWYKPERYAAIRQAALNKHVVLVDNREAIMTGNFSPGDYVLGRDGIYHAIQRKDVCEHPSDVGLMMMANNILEAMGMRKLQKMHPVHIRTNEGGSLSATYGQWPENGIVSIRVIPDKGKRLASLTVMAATGATIDTKKRTNSFLDGTTYDYYIFDMPNQDVIVTPTWK